MVFDVSQNDCGGMCECPNCHAIAEREESEAGPLFDFVNFLADAIRAEYPGVCIDTLAYMMTQKAPKTIQPRDNVIVRLCDTESNSTKPITHPDNTKFRDHLLSWALITKNLRIWDYAVTYAMPYGLPLPTAHTYPADFQFYAEHHVEGVFTELEYPILADMRDLKVWIMMKLLEDPYRDYTGLVRTFTDGFYGPAAEPIRRYLARLERASETKSSYLSMGALPSQYRYLDIDFVPEAMALFDEAEKVAAGDPTLLRRVRHARLPLDRAAVILFPQLVKQWTQAGHPPERIPLDREAIAARYKNTWYEQIDFRIPETQRVNERLEAERELHRYLGIRANVSIPDRFRDIPLARIFQFTPEDMRNWQDIVRRVPDPDLGNQLTGRLELSDEDMKKYALPMAWGLYDVENKRGAASGAIRAEDVPGPGYHWYKLATCPIGPTYYLYFFWSWIIQIDVDGALDVEHSDQPFDLWANIKFEGPGFPHGTPNQKNAICVERVVLVRTEK